MSCNDDYCDFKDEDEIWKCPKCGGMPIMKVNTLTAWIRCSKCGYCVTGATESEVTEKWTAKARS